MLTEKEKKRERVGAGGRQTAPLRGTETPPTGQNEKEIYDDGGGSCGGEKRGFAKGERKRDEIGREGDGARGTVAGRKTRTSSCNVRPSYFFAHSPRAAISSLMRARDESNFLHFFALTSILVSPSSSNVYEYFSALYNFFYSVSLFFTFVSLTLHV